MYGKSGYSVGSSLTYADLYIHEVAKSNILRNDPKKEILDQFPNIQNVIKSVESNQNVAQYLKKRKDIPF